MGEVYRARDTRLGRDVAIKILPQAFALDGDRLARFDREAKTVASLNHPHIAHVYGIEQAGSLQALVMELVEGQDLAQRLEAGPIPVEESLAIARQIAEALEAAHERGVIHRDLKPANIKVDPDGVVKVLDFGLAKSVDGGAGELANSPTLSVRATEAGVILGTAAYMAPEQARGRAIDRRADIWAFGVVLFEMLTGRRAFDGDTVSDLIASVIKETPPLEALPPDLPRPVRRLIERCLEKDPKQRLRDIGEARVLLSRPFDEPAVAPPIAPAAPPARAARSSRILLTGSLILAAIGIAAAIASFVTRPAAVAVPVVRFEIPPPADATLMDAVRPSVAVSPDGSLIAFVATTNGVQRLYVRRRDGVEVRQLPGTEEATNPAFSPDGRWIAFFSNGSLKKVPLDGPPIALAPVNDPRGLAWLSNSEIVYSGQPVAAISVIAADGGQPRAITKVDPASRERTHRWPAPLPGGKAILFTVGDVDNPDNYESSTIAAVILATGERRVVLRGASLAAYSASGHLLFARGGSLHAIPFDPERLTTSGTAMPVVSDLMGDRTTGAAHFSVGADGTLAYLPGTAQGGMRILAWVDPAARVVPLEIPPGLLSDVRISPDGTRVAYVQGTSGQAGSDLWVFHLTTKSTTRLTFDGHVATPVWSADSQHVYYASIDGIGKTTIRRKPADGSRDAETVAQASGRLYLKDVIGTMGYGDSVMDVSAKADLISIPFDSAHPASVKTSLLAPTPADEYAADVSPDGRWIAYQADDNVRYEVYVRSLVSSGRWQISTTGGEEPHWSADGRTLYFRYDDGIYAVEVDTSTGFSTTVPKLLFRGAYNLRFDTGLSFDVDPKSRRFLMLRPAVAQADRRAVRVVVNWFDELRAKLTPAR
jgi:Tol biopolymer transport system component